MAFSIKTTGSADRSIKEIADGIWHADNQNSQTSRLLPMIKWSQPALSRKDIEQLLRILPLDGFFEYAQVLSCHFFRGKFLHLLLIGMRHPGTQGRTRKQLQNRIG